MPKQNVKLIALSPVKETTEDYEAIELHIKQVFLKLLYGPILQELLLSKKILNARKDPLIAAIEKGHVVTYQRAGVVVFEGKFDAKISKRLKELGAKWDKRTKTFALDFGDVSPRLNHEVKTAAGLWRRRAEKVADKLAQISPEIIAGSTDATAAFDSSLKRVDRDLTKSLQGIAVPPQVSDDMRRRIAAEWQHNLRLSIKDFAEKEIVELRKNVQKAIFAGARYESLVKTIKASYGVTERKAKFLARQETSLLMTKFKEARYTEAGINEYRWSTVKGSPNHPVRPSHKILDGKVFRWNDPPITTAPDEPQRRNNPGQDFNCRCTAIPLVRKQSA